MGKIIINNETSLSDSDIIRYVWDVINGGKVSKTGKREHYCHATTYRGNNLVVYSGVTNTGSYTFRVYDDKE